MNSNTAQPFVQVRTDMYKNFRSFTVVGKALLESLSEMLLSGDIKKNLAYNILQQFDYHIIKYIRIGRGTRQEPEDDRPSVTFESNQLLSYRHHPSDSGNGQLWQFLLKNVTINLEFRTSVVQTFVNFCKYERGDKFSPTRIQLLKKIRKEERLKAKEEKERAKKNLLRGRSMKRSVSNFNFLKKVGAVEKTSEVKNNVSITVEINLPYVLIIAYSPFFHRPVTRLSDSDLVLHHGWWCKPLVVDVNTNPRLEFVEFKKEEKSADKTTRNTTTEECRNETTVEKEVKNVPHRVRSSNMYKQSYEEKHKSSYNPKLVAQKICASTRTENQNFCSTNTKTPVKNVQDIEQNGTNLQYNTRGSKKDKQKTLDDISVYEPSKISDRTNRVLHNILQRYPRKPDIKHCKEDSIHTSESIKCSGDAKIRMNHPHKLAPPKAPIKISSPLKYL